MSYAESCGLQNIALIVQAQRTASEKRRARRTVNQRFLTAMVEMGIPVDRAELALSETGNVGIEVSTSRNRAQPPTCLLCTHLTSS